jgi:formylglycine-generating enzyme
MPVGLVARQRLVYDGRLPYQFAVKGEFRRRTVPVKELPANVWGLYQMHGNVWEWCVDPWRKYGAQAMLDPGLPNFLAPLVPLAEGQQGQKVMRGGSWRDRARFARSAFRLVP